MRQDREVGGGGGRLVPSPLTLQPVFRQEFESRIFLGMSRAFPLGFRLAVFSLSEDNRAGASAAVVGRAGECAVVSAANEHQRCPRSCSPPPPHPPLPRSGQGRAAAKSCEALDRGVGGLARHPQTRSAFWMSMSRSNRSSWFARHYHPPVPRAWFAVRGRHETWGGRSSMPTIVGVPVRPISVGHPRPFEKESRMEARRQGQPGLFPL